ncbi:MAG: prepilin-type N-terminal cleavage/methylation domain-containing protein [Acidobacteria bacterium]|nr:prepilin-type N-terminal cleavage/methylation domain-containing protein [Acidobacteriota bacterium]
MKNLPKYARGFSLLEVMVAVAIFTIITGAVFSLLTLSQQRYKEEQEFMDSFQTARLALDTITRDIHASGYPAGGNFLPAVATANPQNVSFPFAWAPGYAVAYPVAASCTVGGTCAAAGGPSAYDLIVEGQLDPALSPNVQWVRYRLVGTTLMRGTAIKVAGGDPVALTQANEYPYVENVINNSAADMAQVQQNYPAMFPGSVAVPIFTYTQDANPPGGMAANDVRNIREVEVTLIVKSPRQDAQTVGWRVVTLNGRARRMNPAF